MYHNCKVLLTERIAQTTAIVAFCNINPILRELKLSKVFQWLTKNIEMYA